VFSHGPHRRLRISGVFIFTSLILLFPLLTPAKVDPKFLSGLKPRSIGPAGMSGRIACVDVALSDPRIIYVGAATGGLWKSADGGVTWKPVFDDQSTSSIGDVTIDPTNPEVVWVGTGEANPRNSAGVGRGVFKTIDGGDSWEFLGLEKTERISRILLDPQRPETVYVAAMGTSWGENTERGVFKTTDGGKTWKKVLYVDEKTGAADLAMDPGNPNRLLAAMWEHRRWPWFFRSGGPGSGLFLTLDGGTTWKRITSADGLPPGDLGRIGIAFSRSRPDVVYALVEAEKSALCRSEDRGRTWKVVNDSPGVSPRPFYYADIRVHPTQENTVYRLASSLDVSEDGGRTFKRLMPFSSVHGDFHDLWIHPESGDTMVVGGDGGVAVSFDRGKHWNFVQNLPLGQFYHVSVDLENPYNVYGGFQDNGSWRGPSRVLQGPAIFNFHWTPVGWGDGFGTLAVPRNPKLGYSMSQGGYLVRFNTVTGEWKDIRPPAPTGTKLRFNWNAAIAVDPLEPRVLYYGSQFLHRSTDEGQTWTIISPDLTTNNPRKQQQALSGGLTRDVTHAENHCTILTIAPSHVQGGVIWVGTDDGKVQLTRDGGKSWTDLTGKLTGLKDNPVPEGTWCPHIEASHFDAGTAYVVFDDHRRSNWKPYVYITENFGETWQSLASDDIDGFVHVIREDTVAKNLLFLGTEFGLHISFDRGRSWTKWSRGLPTVPVRDMVIHPLDNDLVIGTHGRSAYILDDIQPLREIRSEVMEKPLHLFSVADCYQFWTSFFGPGYLTPGDAEFQGQNRPYGALITYSLALPEEDASGKEESAAAPSKNQEKEEEDAIKIEIISADGKVVRTLEGPRKPGMNRVSWDLRHEPFRSLVDPFEDFFPVSGPFVLPGTYRVRVRLGDHTAEEAFRVLPDPRESVSASSRKAKHDLIMQNGRFIETVTDAYRRIEKTLEGIDFVLGRSDQIKVKHREEVKTLAEEMKKKLQAFADNLNPPRERSGIYEEVELALRLAAFESRLESSFDAPTAGQQKEYIELKAAVNQAVYKINRFYQDEFPRFVQKVKEAGFAVFPEYKPIEIKDR